MLPLFSFQRLANLVTGGLLLLVFLLQPSGLFGGQTLSVGVYNNKPTIFLGEGNKPRGLFIDILEEIAQKEDWTLNYVPDHFSSLLSQAKTGDIDLLPAIAYSEERTRFLDYTYQTVMANWAELYVGNNQRLVSILDLEGKKIAVKQGDIHFRALKELTRNFNVSCRFFEADGYVTVFEMVSAGYADVGVVNRLFGNARKGEFSVRETPVIFNPIEMRFAVQKNSHQVLLNTIDTHLARMKADQDSVYYRSINRWLLVDSETRLPGWFYQVVWLSVGATLLFLTTAIVFRHQIRKKTAELRRFNRSLKEEIERRTETQKRLHKLARVVETSADGMALIDLQHRHLLFNRAYSNLFYNTTIIPGETSLEEVVGESMFSRQLQDGLESCLQGRTAHLQTEPDNKEGSVWNITLTPYILDDDTLDGYVIDIRDVSHQMALENRLKNAQKMEAIGLLAGGVAHDLNNILSGVVSYPDMLLMNREKNDPMVGPLTAIKKTGERAAAIVQDLLALSRRGLGQAEVLQLNHLIGDYLESLESADLLKEHKGVSCTTEFDENLWRVYGSRVHLQKVIMNLFTNGVEAMPMGGVLSIRTENVVFEEQHLCYEAIPKGEYVAVHFKDGGVGMAPREISRIFEPFYSNKVMGRSGTGLGMAVVWGTIKDHMGYIDIDSFPQQGTLFSIYFPATSDLLPDSREQSLEELRGEGELILVVDDLGSQRTLATQILELLNYSVQTASSGTEAYEFCKTRRPDLLLLDMVMPGGPDGYETYKRILTVQPGQKAVIASGFSETEQVQKTQQLGAGRYLRKPYSVEDLGSAIKEELEKGE